MSVDVNMKNGAIMPTDSLCIKISTSVSKVADHLEKSIAQLMIMGLVDRAGFEPATLGLRVPCSTS